MESNKIITHSLILSKKLFGDGHSSFNILTADIGVVRAPAFGGQRLSKRFKGGLDLFQIIEMEIDHRTKDNIDMYNVSSVKSLITKFKDITLTMERYTAASYMLELASTIITPHERNGKSGKSYYETVLSSLRKIDAENDLTRIMDEVYCFSLNLYRETGFIPEIKHLEGNKNMLQHLEELNSRIIGSAPKSFALLYKTMSICKETSQK